MENKATAQSKPISITRELALPLHTVWRAWTEAESLKKWWAPGDYTVPFCKVDLRIGGKVLSSMKSPDGTITYSTGTYKEIVPEKKIVVTDSFADSDGNPTGPPAGMKGDWSQPKLITVELEEKNGKTNLSIIHTGIPIEEYDNCVQGWNMCIDKIGGEF